MLWVVEIAATVTSLAWSQEAGDRHQPGVPQLAAIPDPSRLEEILMFSGTRTHLPAGAGRLCSCGLGT